MQLRKKRRIDPAEIAIRDSACREALPYNADDAEYPFAQRYQLTRAEGIALIAEQKNEGRVAA